MGACESSPETAAAVIASKQIDKLLRDDMKKMENTVKLLLLGTGETGKSTVLKQIKLIYGKGFEAEEKKVFRSAVLSNILTCIKTLAISMDTLKIPFGFKWQSSHISTAKPSKTEQVEEVGSPQNRSSMLSSELSSQTASTLKLQKISANVTKQSIAEESMMERDKTADL
ncbi:G-alpha-domain-containing protein [Rhizoclosmatium globosum]|uniref:G-alpha-domain-containing protein n=1 Tax=Rhizoclosmatium globosum TaxID=329046 RepID=A0A1Y2CXG7_9FUNG|nr:G-alpha-domain-containing protein [Rhizoclosmatium globosum]|eukprot:ORY51667.1 G-alpha-domain-containing protein [Rhizoclosmatium globosum]